MSSKGESQAGQVRGGCENDSYASASHVRPTHPSSAPSSSIKSSSRFHLLAESLLASLMASS